MQRGRDTVAERQKHSCREAVTKCQIQRHSGRVTETQLQRGRDIVADTETL